jgi:hypothetical protein
MAGLLVIKIIAVVLSVLSLSAATFSAADLFVPDDSSQTCQDDAGLVALVGYQIFLPLYKATAYLFYQERETFHQASAIFRHTYRGPPTLS